MPIPKSVFREYDVRGIVPKQINSLAITVIVSSLGEYFARRSKGRRVKIVIGHDPRHTSVQFYKNALQALQAFPQFTIINAGLMTTPMLYYMVSSMHAAGGIIITASHNPLNYNGLKAVRERAINISGFEIGEIVAKLGKKTGTSIKSSRKQAQDVSQEARHDYAKFLEGLLALKSSVKVVVDCSNSPTGVILAKIKKKGLKLVLLNKTPDGNFPAHGPNPLKAGSLDELKRKVKRARADFGVIFDGDADRIMFVDNKNSPVHPDVAAFLLMKNFTPPFVMDARTGWLVRRSGVPVIISRVGHTNVKKVMRARNAAFASETSGHYFFRNRFGQDVAHNDSALQALMYTINEVSHLKRAGYTLDAWIKKLPKSERREVNFEVKNTKAILAKIEAVYKKEKDVKIGYLDGVTVEVGGPCPFWFNIRPSANEPVLRLSLEAQVLKTLEQQLRKIAALVGAKKTSVQGVL